MVKRGPYRLWAWIAASGVAGCTAIVGVDQDYELDPRFGQDGAALTGGTGAGTGGATAGGSGGTAGSGGVGTGGTAGNDAGKDAGGSGGGTGGSDASAGAGGSGGSAATGGTAGVGGGGAGTSSGAGGVSGGGGTGGVSGTGGVGGVSGTGGAGGTGGGGTGGASGAGTGGSGGAAGTGGAGGSSGIDGGGAAGRGGAAGSGGAGGSTTDGGDASTGGSAGATSDASSDGAPDTPADLGSPCGPGTKFCGVCVPTSDPNYGCAGPTCTPCEPNGTATCNAGNCVVTGCNSGYHQVGNACVPNGPEICDNNIDDDADTRTDCFDSDCLGHASCANKCTDATTIACDTVVTGQSSTGTGSTSRISSYSCAPGTYAGSEFAYRFTGGSGQRVFAEIYGLSGNLGLFQVGAASGQQCLSSSCGTYGDVATNSGAEALGFDSVAGQDYFLVVDGPLARNYSLSVQCSTLDGCRPTRAIEPGQTFSNVTNNPASGASNVTASKVPTYFGDVFTIPESGPEAAWIFTPTVSDDYRVTVSSLSQDCDAFVLTGADCFGTLLSPTSYSDNFGTTTEIVNFQGVANTTYYIVVDGYAGAICTFNINLTQL